MGRWLSLMKVLKSPEEYGNLSRRQVNYVPDQGRVQLSESDTGCGVVQNFSTELSHTWYPFMYEGKVYLIAGEATEAKLWLCGKIGYKNGISSLKKIAKLYGNESLGVQGIGLTPRVFSTLSKHLKDIEDMYWLCEQFKAGCYFGLQFVDSYGVGGLLVLLERQRELLQQCGASPSPSSIQYRGVY